MRITRTLLIALAVALAAAFAAAGCGGGNDAADRDPQEILDATFANQTEIASGKIDLTLNVAVEGEESGAFNLNLAGPFRVEGEGDDRMPQVDLSGTVGGEAQGQGLDVDAGLVVTEDNLYVEYQGRAYELGEKEFADLQREAKKETGGAAGEDDPSASFEAACKQAMRDAGGDPSACDFDVRGWLSEVTNEGTEEVGGVETVHVHGTADPARVLSDLGALAATLPEAQRSGFNLEQLGQFSEMVTEASFDVYSGVDDDILRGLDGRLTIEPQGLGAAVGVPVEKLQIEFSIELSEVNEEQTIEAPERARPIDELLGGLDQFLPDADDLGFGLGGGGGGGSSSGRGGGGNGADSDAYLDCVAQAKPSQINECLKRL